MSNFLHTPPNWSSWGCWFWDICALISSHASLRLDEAGFQDLWDSSRVVHGGGTSRISFLEASTNFLDVFNMSATMTRHWGQVQLKHSNMYLPFNVAKITTWGFLHMTIEEMQYLIEKPYAKFQDDRKRGVELPTHRKVMAAGQIHPAIVWECYTVGCLPWKNGTSNNLQSHWIHKGTGGPLPQPVSSQSRTSPVPHTDNQRSSMV